MRNIYFARSNEALLDIDTERQFRQFLQRFPTMLSLVVFMVILATRPHHYHVYIKLKKRHRFIDLSALQTYLGSDKSRELANMSRINAHATRPILLIEYSKIRHWRAPDIICACPPKLNGRKFGNCPHLMAARGHRAKYGFLSTRLKTLGVKEPYGRA